jgi:acyl-CoA synthetase (AMP-forming)/AMP-acid ligase II
MKSIGRAQRRGPGETGDIGRLDETDHLDRLDRVDGMMISGGFNVFPAEPENVIVARRRARWCA